MGKYQPQQGNWKHTLYGTDKGEWLVGYSSDDTIYANGGDDTADGVHGTDILDGGDGDDSLLGGTGTDYLTGGLGGDDFVIEANGGWDIVYDFHPEQGDEIWAGSSSRQYTVVQQDGDTFIDFGQGDGVILVGYSAPLSGDLVNFY